jgi:uncharacterized damage-inducible protein DinB
MSVSIDFDNLIGYSDAERAKWEAWIIADPSRLDLAFQPGGRFPTVWSVLEHVFLVERRHLARLEGGVPPEATGIARDDWEALFDYADLVRADFRRYAADLDEETCSKRLTVTVASGGTSTISCRKLSLHIVLHEIRHFAQLAFAVRLAGHAPPGEHDYFYFPEKA